MSTARDRIRQGWAQACQLGADVADAAGTVWGRSLQIRVVISTLALSTAVVLVLGLVLQTQIAGRVVQAKEADSCCPSHDPGTTMMTAMTAMTILPLVVTASVARAQQAGQLQAAAAAGIVMMIVMTTRSRPMTRRR